MKKIKQIREKLEKKSHKKGKVRNMQKQTCNLQIRTPNADTQQKKLTS